jgi:hypothetical protein
VYVNRYSVSIWLFGEPGIDSIVQGELSFFYQLHNDYRRKGLGHAGDE